MKTINKAIILLFSILLFSCEDILEEDISDGIIQIIYPQNNQEISSNVVNFQWNNLQGADNYRIQVFSSNSNIVLDSLIVSNSFSYPLSPGEYQWRVRGENFAYTSSYSLNNSFSVFATSDLTNQQVVLSNPSDNYYTNNSSSLILTWQNLMAATSYSFELINQTNGGSVIYQQTNLTSNSLTLNNTILSQNAEYRWKVKAVNGTTETIYSTRKFFLDTFVPNQPINTLPLNNSTQIINQVVNFSWSIPVDSGIIQSPISYTIEFANDNAFTSIIQTSNTTINTFQQTFTIAGDYYWRVKAIDQAGNFSVVSNIFKFVVN